MLARSGTDLGRVKPVNGRRDPVLLILLSVPVVIAGAMTYYNIVSGGVVTMWLKVHGLA